MSDIVSYIESLKAEGASITPSGIFLPENLYSKKREISRYKSQIKALEDGRGPFLTGDHIQGWCRRIKEAQWLVLDIETTASGPAAQSVKIAQSTKIGYTTWPNYAVSFGLDSKTDYAARPRVRIISTHLDSGSKAAFDLDRCDQTQTRALIEALLTSHVLIGHNITFDLAWVATTLVATGVYPPPVKAWARVVDTLQVAKVSQAAARWQLDIHHSALSDDGARQLVTHSDGLVGFSMQACLQAIGQPSPDKCYQKPQNWTPAALSFAHYQYCLGDVAAPIEILMAATGTESVDQALQYCARCPELASRESATAVLAQMTANGIPLDTTAAQALCQDYELEITEAVRELSRFPEFKAIASSLEDPSVGMTHELKNAWETYAVNEGITLGRTDTGAPALGKRDAALCGLDKTPAWDIWDKRQHAVKRWKMVQEWIGCAHRGAGRVRSMVTMAASTGRTTSSTPNSQNLPRDAAVRSIVQAQPEYTIISADWSQIELRIAAALAARTWEHIRCIAEADNPKWSQPSGYGWLTGDAIEAIRQGWHSNQPINVPNHPSAESTYKHWADYNKAKLAEMVRSVREYEKQHGDLPLRSVYKSGVDAHMATAISLLSQRGEFDLKGKTPIEYLAGLDENQRKELKDRYKAARQSAKAANFGLLYGQSADSFYQYGVTNYGLTWTSDEATEVRDIWLDTYVDLKLWQLMTLQGRTLYKKKTPECYRRNPYTKQMETVAPTTYDVRTLGERPILAWTRNAALNFADQGSGADMLARSLDLLQAEGLDPYLIAVIHDELLLEVPETESEEISETIRTLMVDAADYYLAPYGVPSDTEIEIDRAWKH